MKSVDMKCGVWSVDRVNFACTFCTINKCQLALQLSISSSLIVIYIEFIDTCSYLYRVH